MQLVKFSILVLLKLMVRAHLSYEIHIVRLFIGITSCLLATYQQNIAHLKNIKSKRKKMFLTSCWRTRIIEEQILYKIKTARLLKVANFDMNSVKNNFDFVEQDIHHDSHSKLWQSFRNQKKSEHGME